MKQTNELTYFFEDKPLFAIDIGSSTIRLVQLLPKKGGKWRVVGYGQTKFDPEAIVEGAVVKHEEIAQAIKTLFETELVGEITTDRVAMSLPVARAFTRIIEMPQMTKAEFDEAVQNEAEQYIPASLDSLHIDYTVISGTDNRKIVQIVAIPKRIVESYMILAELLGLTPVLLQTTNTADAHIFSKDSQSDLPSVLVDFGSDSTDITVYDKGPIVSGTVPSGGEQLTEFIQKALDLTPREAMIVKARYGLSYSKKQRQLDTALSPTLSLITREIKRTMRYYEERSTEKQTISQIVILGGGANMPGLPEYYTNSLRLPVRAFDPSIFLDFGHLQPFPENDRMSYVTCVGLAMHNPEEIFND
ncbi:MAG: hypothetical protein QG629_300 [Patescibacteria group bacterium]|nr:type IV pilus assembly protein PilM [Candidatus Saccharibacteria bacterium]MDQ5963218.1 hypothetical protein [Patescibacteria group bacterium]